MSTILPGNQESAALALDGGTYGLLERRIELMKRLDHSIVAYWDGTDAAVSKKWVDRISGKKWQIYNSYTKGSDYYQFDNVGGTQQFATLDDSDFGVDYEIKFVVDFELNPDGEKTMGIVDLGSIGITPDGYWGLYPSYTVDNTWGYSIKYNGNFPQTKNTSGTFPVLTPGAWNPCVIEFGIEHDKSTDKQRAYMKVGEGFISCNWVNKIRITGFRASGVNPRMATTCYGTGSTEYSRSRIRFKTIKVYKKV